MAGNLLWAHLLRKDATTTDTHSQIPPIAPQDKTGTSMRMLIHDTQVNFEKFSTRLDGLLQRVDDCRGQVVNANKLLDVERDKVLSEILEIARRSQAELRAHVGTPAQAPALDLVHVSQVSTENSVQALEKRIDALQTLLQSHSHAMQSIQDQQNALISAVLPLVPVLNAVSPQIDQIKAALPDMVANAVTKNVEDFRSTLVSELTRKHGYVEPPTWIGPPSKATLGLRRKRSNPSVSSENDVPVSSPLGIRGQERPHPSPKRPRLQECMHCSDNTELPRESSHLEVPLSRSSAPPLLAQALQIPRQPLGDLIIRCMRPRGTPRACGGPSTSVYPMSRPPFELPERVPSDFQVPITTRQRSPGQGTGPPAAENSTAGMSSSAGPSDQDIPPKIVKIEEKLPLGRNLTSVISIHSFPLSSAPPSQPPGDRRDPSEVTVPVAQPRTPERPRPQDSTPEVPLVQLVQVPQPSSNPFASNSDGSPPKPMSLRDRRAQMSRIGRTETRRFIPVVPWSDEEE